MASKPMHTDSTARDLVSICAFRLVREMEASGLPPHLVCQVRALSSVLARPERPPGIMTVAQHRRGSTPE